MNFFERVSANFPDKTLGERERNLMAPLVPWSESEHEANAGIQRLEHIVTGPHVSTIPGDEASISSSKPSKKKSRFGGMGIVICAMVSLVTGIAVGAAWSPHSLTENLKSYNFRGVLETIFADSPKGHPTAQATVASVAAPEFSEIQNQLNEIARGVSSMLAAPAAASVTAPDFSEIQNQLNAIARNLSSMQQNINELAAGQEQIRKAQSELAWAEAHLINLRTVANTKRNKQPTHPVIRGSR